MFNKLMPDHYYKNIYDINIDFLKDMGIKGVICDIDNTIAEWSKREMKKEVQSWFEELSAEGFKVCLVTNSLGERAVYFGEKMDIPAVGRAVKPAKRSFLKAQQLLSLPREEIVVVGDQLFTDVLGGNRLGFVTILVDPISKNEFITSRFFRLLEKLFFTRMKDD